MPRVEQRKKSRAGKTVHCITCRQPIEPGQQFFKWTFRYGGSRYRHVEHGYPRPSMLTQSRLGDVYEQREAIEDQLMEEFGPDDVPVLDDLLSTVVDVADEYEAAAEPFGGAGENQERADALRDYESELEGVDVEEFVFDEDADESREEQLETWRDDVRETIQAALDALAL
jgi:hypothetical protein